jgi:AAA family ATP:ADP antiporter
VVKAFVGFLGGEDGEEKPILLLLGMGFFMGFYTASYEVSATTLFLNALGKEYLSEAFFVAGFLGIFTTILFTFVQKRINFSTLALTNVFLIFCFLCALRYAFSLPTETLQYFNFLPFLLFVMIGPIAAILYLTFWGLFGRMFNLKQNKRIVGGIDTGQLTATIIAFFSIPLLLSFVIGEIYNLLFIAAGSALLIFIFVFLIVRSYNVDAATKVNLLAGEEQDGERADISYADLFKNPFYKWMSLFLMASMGASIFVDYTFYTAAETMYPAEKDLASFLSFFEATTMIFVFIFQSFFNDKIIEDYGLKFSLRVMPIILLFFTVGVIFTGHVYGYEFKTDEYLLFFIFNVMAKLFIASIKDSLENPAFKLFFLPIPVRIRFSAQNMIEGVVNQIAILLAGALQIGLGFLVFFKLIHYSYFVLGLAVLIIWLAAKVFEEYKKTLKSSLESSKKELVRLGLVSKNEMNTINSILKQLKSDSDVRVMNALKLLEKVDPLQLEFSLLDQLKSRHVSVRKYAYKKLGDSMMFNSFTIVERASRNEQNKEIQKLAFECTEKLKNGHEFELNFNNIRPLVRSINAEDRVYAARLLSKIQDEKLIPFLKELMRDINVNVRKAAIISAGKTRMPELWSILIENLHLPIYSNTASSALTSNGESIFPSIDAAFYKTNQYFDTMDRSIQMYGRVGGRTAAELLWKKIDFPDRKIISELLLSLSYIGFEAKDFQASRIKLGIENDIGDVAWNIKTMDEIERDDQIDEYLFSAFKEENEKNYNDIFMLMSMVYDPENILLVKENIRVGTSESITFAIEMLNLFIDEDLKKKIVPILDDLTEEQRLTRLRNFFPPESFASYGDMLNQIVNRDYNHVNRWTKALALWKIAHLKDTEVGYDLIANLFNPDPFLLEAAALVIYKLDKDAYYQHTKRLIPKVKKDLDRVILPPIFNSEDEEYHQKMIGIEKAIFLKGILVFSEIPGWIITEVAESIQEKFYKKGDIIQSRNNQKQIPLYIVYKGLIESTSAEGEKTKLASKSVFGENYIVEGDSITGEYVALADTTLLELSKDELFDLMSKHIEITEAFIDIINGDIAEEERHEEVFDSIFA